ncbi:4-hydroxy-2-oxoheptanedioate aldolase [Singulisphaera sp. GP187]|uniref:HpcH/HpaI aldolase family protein n=1 Tax=Singulisphaera sp. GP187 TaxID=1882752 RepID=UPI00092AA29D|nr:aldolase/citrate lyase family protein [Singulisphaera sp. GP187]SIO55482.1 4-hydroxy-2-oxoheptanedioate aldolase [Singulisphaera sp. GP187]
MRFSRVKAKLRRGEPALITCCHLIDPCVYELTSLLGFDGIWLDLEHHSTSDETASHLMRAARVGVSDIIARPAKGEYMRMARLLEAGAQGIMYPRCESAEEAAEVVRWAKFAPQGERGVDGANGDAPYCGMPMPPYLQAANEHTLIIVQLESLQALDQAEAIARVPGVDVLMLGPGDLSVLSGIPYQFDHPIISDALRRTAAAAKSAGKWWGTVTGTPEHTQMLMDLGATFLCHGADILMVKKGLEHIQERYAPLGFTFENRIAAEAAELARTFSTPTPRNTSPNS